MAHRLAEEAEADLDEIWWRIATESGSVVTAQEVVSSITERFYLLARYPQAGAAA
jgi:plasmid stabilization system protein ParE